MTNTTEYANTTNGSIADNYLELYNGAPRYRCNNPIGTGVNQTPIAQAKETYEELYNIYNNKNKNELVTKTMFSGEDGYHCIASQKNNCPHKPDATNLIAYTKEDGTQKLYVKDLQFYLDDCGARIRNYDNNNAATASYKQIKDSAISFRDGSYNQLVNLRSDLDKKMNEILGNNKNSILYEKQSELDATVYSTLLWTVMVTSLLYYVFTKI